MMPVSTPLSQWSNQRSCSRPKSACRLIKLICAPRPKFSSPIGLVWRVGKGCGGLGAGGGGGGGGGWGKGRGGGGYVRAGGGGWGGGGGEGGVGAGGGGGGAKGGGGRCEARGRRVSWAVTTYPCRA